MLSIVSCKSLGIPASGYLNTWKVGTLWTRSIEVAQQPKICSANHSHTRSLIPVASSPKSPVLLKNRAKVATRHVITHFVSSLRTIWIWAGWKWPSSFPSAALGVLGWDRTARALGPCHASRLHLPNDERGDSYRGSSVPPACPVGALRHNALL